MENAVLGGVNFLCSCSCVARELLVIDELRKHRMVRICLKMHHHFFVLPPVIFTGSVIGSAMSKSTTSCKRGGVMVGAVHRAPGPLSYLSWIMFGVHFR